MDADDPNNPGFQTRPRWYGWHLFYVPEHHGNKFGGVLETREFYSGDLELFRVWEFQRWDGYGERELALRTFERDVYIPFWKQYARNPEFDFRGRLHLLQLGYLCPKRDLRPLQNNRYAYTAHEFRSIVKINRELRFADYCFDTSDWLIGGSMVTDRRMHMRDHEAARWNGLTQNQRDLENAELDVIFAYQKTLGNFHKSYQVDQAELEFIDLKLQPYDLNMLATFKLMHAAFIEQLVAGLNAVRERISLHHLSRVWGVVEDLRETNPDRERDRLGFMLEEERNQDSRAHQYVDCYKSIWKRNLEDTMMWIQSGAAPANTALNADLLHERLHRDFAVLLIHLEKQLRSRHGDHITPLRIPLLHRREHIADYQWPNVEGWTHTDPRTSIDPHMCEVHAALGNALNAAECEGVLGNLRVEIRLSWDQHRLKLGTYGRMWEDKQRSFRQRWFNLHGDHKLSDEAFVEGRVKFLSVYAAQQELHHGLQFIECMNEVDSFICQRMEPKSLFLENCIKYANELVQMHERNPPLVDPPLSTPPPVFERDKETHQPIILKKFNASSARNMRSHLQLIDSYLIRGGLCNGWSVMNTIAEATKQLMKTDWNTYATRQRNEFERNATVCAWCNSVLYDGTLVRVFSCESKECGFLRHGEHVACQVEGYCFRLQHSIIDADLTQPQGFIFRTDIAIPEPDELKRIARAELVDDPYFAFPSVALNTLTDYNKVYCYECNRQVDRIVIYSTRNELKEVASQWPLWDEEGGPNDSISSTNRSLRRAHEFRVLEQLKTLYQRTYKTTELVKFTCFCGRFSRLESMAATFDKYQREFLQSVLYLGVDDQQLKVRFFHGICIDNNEFLMRLIHLVFNDQYSFQEMVDMCAQRVNCPYESPSFIALKIMTISTFIQLGETLTKHHLRTYHGSVLKRFHEFSERIGECIGISDFRYPDHCLKHYFLEGLRLYPNECLNKLITRYKQDTKLSFVETCAQLCDEVELIWGRSDGHLLERPSIGSKRKQEGEELNVYM